MGSLGDDNTTTSEEVSENEEGVELKGEDWPYCNGAEEWQTATRCIRDRIANLFDCRQMSDVCVLANDENWWFGETVKDFSVSIVSTNATYIDIMNTVLDQAHKVILGSASPVLYHLLYELDPETNPDKRLFLDKRINVTLTLVPCYEYVRCVSDVSRCQSQSGSLLSNPDLRWTASLRWLLRPCSSTSTKTSMS